MAESEPSSSRTNSLNTSSSHNDENHTHVELKGYLWKRTKLSRKWKKQWFILRNSDLLYGNTPETAVKNIPLSNAEISETDVDKKDHAFRIKPKDNGRTFYIQAENENVQNDWMQAICFAKAAGHHGDNSQACTIQ
ncbi:interactor protein for cytohesin exchange factors 1-like [Crassostrea angulata]|uniref:PH domain-containing protein n=1 Tax=Magallana gigas TaxID=29159 RepID=K1QZ52_MAGGI|nr:interactor protein for cytohesin exchange factors 1-like [Crassostrea gigas]XP_052697038.1 interactor protein for cytohesin exchange factors 1-like [Crassostrea angulata]